MPTADFELDFASPAATPPVAGQGGVREQRGGEPRPSAPVPLIDLSGMLRSSPPWLVSAVVHMVALIVFGLLMSVSAVDVPFILNARYAEELGEIDLDAIDDLHVPQEVTIEQTELSSDDLPVVLDPLSMPDMVPIQPEGLAMASNMPSINVGVALSGRQPGMREALRDAYGGNVTTERAVLDGLAWLARNQRSNGSWSLRGPYQDGSSRENAEAATAMALLAFQGHGYTHKPLPSDEFPRVVSRGWNWLLAQQYADGHFFQDDVGDARLYTHAQCTIAICELYAMTNDYELRKPAQKAVDYCVKIQTSAGGWRYDPGRGEDLSVTGWFAMALQSARMAGLEVPSDAFKRLDEYLDTVEKEYGSRYSYQPRQGATPAMTAEGLLCRQYLGWERDDERLQQGVAWLLTFLPEWDERNVYQWYYTTQVMHHMEGNAWQQWNAVMRQLLPERQEKRGRERGSWDPNGDRWGSQGGRLFTTCLSIYMLEVYYRHMPLYGRLAVEQ